MARAENRHQRQRVIAKRLRMCKVRGWAPFRPGRLAKYNLACGCYACRGERYQRRRVKVDVNED